MLKLGAARFHGFLLALTWRCAQQDLAFRGTFAGLDPHSQQCFTAPPMPGFDDPGIPLPECDPRPNAQPWATTPPPQDRFREIIQDEMSRFLPMANRSSLSAVEFGALYGNTTLAYKFNKV